MDAYARKTIHGFLIEVNHYSNNVDFNKKLKQDNEDYGIVFGYYDTINIYPIHQWLEYSPGHRDNLKKQNNVENHSTYYPLKLLFPKTDVEKAYSEFSYIQWRDYAQLLNDNPCMTLALINLTDDYKCNIDKAPLESILDLIRCQPSIAEKLKDQHCCILPSMGYSDLCILCASTEWASAISGMHELRKINIDGKIVVSEDYIIPAYWGKIDDLNYNHFNDLSVMIDVSVAPEWEPVWKAEVTKNYEDSEDKIETYRITGGSDYLLRANNAKSSCDLIKKILKLNMMFNEISSQLCIASATNDTEQTQITLPSASKPLFSQKEEEFRETIRTFNLAVDCFDKALERNCQHRRLSSALLEMAEDAKTICMKKHNGDMRDIMKDLLDATTFCLYHCAENIEYLDIAELEENIDHICGSIDSFLIDLSRSDCMFMDREKYDHASVGSATKIIVAYNKWINQFTRSVQELMKEHDKNRSSFSFLVTSGGQDITYTSDVFSTLRISRRFQSKIPLITHMSEMSLYDFSGTVFRCVHECMHFCGNRFRKQRKDYFICFVTELLSEMYVMQLYPDKIFREYLISVYEQITGEKCPDNVVCRLYELSREWRTDLRKKIQSAMAFSEDFSENELYMDEMKELVYARLMRAFSGLLVSIQNGQSVLMPSEMTSSIVKAVQEVIISFYQACDQILKENGVDTVLPAFEERKQQIQYRGNIDREMDDSYLEHLVTLITSRLLVSEPSDRLMEMEKNEAEIREPSSKEVLLSRGFPLAGLTTTGLYYTVEMAADVFSETFSDVMACEILGASLEDYLLMHLFENWDINSALEESDTVIFRLGAVMRVCFPNCLKEDHKDQLTETTWSSIVNAVRSLEIHGYSSERLGLDFLYERIQSILREYERIGFVGSHLEQYLGYCVQKYRDENVFDKLGIFSASYKNMRMTAIPGNASNHDELLGMYDSLLLGAGKDNEHGRKQKVL